MTGTPQDVRDGEMPLGLVLDSALRHNVAAFATYCREADVELAPHVKTTMCRQVFRAQADGGAWGATVASVAQARVLRSWGCRRIFIANEVVDPAALDWIVAENEHEDCELYFWVDSVAGLRAAVGAHGRAGARSPLRVLVEVGHPGGRAGCRTLEQALDVAEAVARSEVAQVHGVACFEGLIAPADADVEVTALLALAETVAQALRARDLVAAERLILTAGGSAYFDRVVAAFAAQPRERTRVVLRSGCYVMHDVGFYEEQSPLGGSARAALRSALEVWAPVVSTPEPGLAIVGFGKREVGFDMGLPRPLKLRRDGETQVVRGGLDVVALNDQHAHLSDPAGRLAVGDVLGVGVSHPCTTLDKWPVLALVDDDYRLLEWLDTQFGRH